jgi:hypothetical protein
VSGHNVTTGDKKGKRGNIMDSTCLLDKNVRIQLTIVKELMNSMDAIPKKEFNKRLALSNFVFETNLDELIAITEALNIGITVHVFKQKNAEYIKISKKTESNLKKLYFYYLERSLNYQILVSIYQGEARTITHLTQIYNISESVVYRRIGQLNNFLKEFDVQIKNGHLYGDELKVCYFLYHFFLNSIPLNLIEDRVEDTSVNTMISFLEIKLHQKFSIMNRFKLHLWSNIIKRRSIYSSPVSEFPPDFLKLFNKDPLYKITRQAYFQMISHTATGGNEFKAFYIYIFLSSMFILPPSSLYATNDSEEWPTQIPKVIEMNNIALGMVREHFHINMEIMNPDTIREWRYIVTQVHSQLYFFKNFISVSSAGQVIPQEVVQQNVSDSIMSLASLLIHKIENTLAVPLLEETEKNTHWIYINLIKQIEDYSADVIYVGTYSYVDYMRATVLALRINDLFKTQYHIKVEMAHTGEHYDLLIADSDYDLSEYHYDFMYLLSEAETKLDINDIDLIMDQIYRKKKNL